MKRAELRARWYYVDEAGDPAFYAKGKKLIVGQEGCSKTFAVGFLRTFDPTRIREQLAEVHSAVLSDRYLKDIPSVHAKTIHGFHAKDDCQEVRKMVYEALDRMDFRVQIVIARKMINVFEKRHKGSQDVFYDDLVVQLFKNQLHLAAENNITFAKRGSKDRQHSLRTAVEKGIKAFQSKCKDADRTVVRVESNQSRQEPVLQVVDYALWAVQRAFEKREMRYFEYLRPKFELVVDLYDYKKYGKKNGNKEGRGSCIYDRSKNPFHIDLISPLSSAPPKGQRHEADIHEGELTLL